ncbi:hypothetical protein K9N08_00505 [Candidatus Gracilibacteria bacterium]|nr:hypothetical protein [Candidatus Gracilibacteria bacterium]MCF7856026.1 hypothetical protein [Candidatus Gracilibacteria bacterium]MCF7896419.1 hypothetical protein [Candidatus Gracilibacteria bacterium]
MMSFSSAKMRKYLFLGCIFLLAIFAVLDFDFNLAVDKFSHLKISLLLFTLIFAVRLTFRRHLSEAVALVLALRDVLIIGIFKELLDGAIGTGIPELADLIADVIGIAIPLIGLLLAEFFGIGYESFVHAGSPKLLRAEKNYFKKQIHFLRHAGFKLFYQI